MTTFCTSVVLCIILALNKAAFADTQQQGKCAEQANNAGPARVGAYIPQCDSDGNFLPQQYWPSTGYLWCVHTISGEEIPGTQTPPGHPPPNCGKIKVKCAEQANNARPGLIGAYIPQCDGDGNFLPQQCWPSTGYCWCVHIISGKEIPGTKAPPGHPPPNCGFVHRWCLTSDQELRKCTDLAAAAPVFSCVKRGNSHECIQAIKNGEADAVTLDGGDVYTAGLNNYDLQPIIAEDYGLSSDTCFYAVAVVKKGSGFSIKELRGKKSCHSGLGDSAGWNIPIGTLLAMDLIQWAGMEDKPLGEAVGEFFSASCVPGAPPGSTLCQLCRGDCSKSHAEPYYGDAGAYQCLAGCNGDVAFVSHLTVPESEKANFELLCKDGTRKPIDEYQNCHLARVPAHAVVSRRDKDLADLIYASISTVSNFNLFSSEAYAPAKNLMFSDSAVNLTRLPSSMDSLLYLGAEHLGVIHSLRRVSSGVHVAAPHITICAVGHAESAKCDVWSINSIEEDAQKIECQSATTVEDCMKKILRKEADAVVMDAGHLHTAGKCGLIPAMVEQYSEDLCSTSGSASSYYAVAVVKKNSGVTWDTLKGKRSCHTGIDRAAGWNIPMGLIYKATNDCDFNEFFVSGCAPGADPGSSFCSQCAGSGRVMSDEAKCKPNADEKYYGFTGAFRCLVEGSGDVAFVKHTTVSEISDGAGPVWAHDVKSTDFELICPGMANAPVTDYVSCHLATVPAHVVVTRLESRDKVVRILKEQQAKFGNQGSDPTFRMFQSDEGKNLLFRDSTKCLQEVPAGTTYKQFLGPEYVTAMDFLRNCSETVPGLERACAFHSCLQKD